MSKSREIADQNAITVDNYPASQTPTPNAIPVADSSGKLNSWVDAAGTGDMSKSTYDTNDNGIVDKAESLDDGTNSSTALEVSNHIANISNPHSVTATQVGLGNVTNDAQLKRADGDINSFTEKTTPASGDMLLIEDSASSYAKKKVQIGNLPTGSGGSSTFTGLTDTPSSYSGQQGKVVAVKSTEDGVEFVAASGTGDMTKSVYDTDNNGIVDNADAVIGKVPTATPTANAIPIADGNGKLDGWVNADMEKSVYDANNDGIVDNTEKVKSLDVIGQQTITSSSGSATIDWNAGTNATITLTENTTLTFTNPTSSCHLQLEIAQDSTGGYTLTLPTIKWAGGFSPILSTAANNISVISLYFDGTNYLGMSSDNFA